MNKWIFLVLSCVFVTMFGVRESKADTVLTFDDLTGDGQVPNGYAGINWNDQWAYYDNSQPPYNPESGNERIYNLTSTGDRPEDAFFNFTSPVVFKGAYFAGFDITTVNFNLYDGASLVWTSAGINPTATPTFLSSNYSGPVTAVDVHDTGSSGTFDFYVMDNVTFAGTTAAPEPSAIVPLCGLLALIGLAVRRRIETSRRS